MGKVRDIANKLKNFNINFELDQAISNSQDQLLDFNRSQLAIGQLSDGSEISPFLRSQAYARGKKSLGGKAPEGVPDLKDRGNFYKGFFLVTTKEVVKITSRDSKTPDLRAKYGLDIFGLQPLNRQSYARNYILPYLQNSIRTKVL